MMNPPMPTLSPVCTRIRVDKLTACAGVAVGVAVTPGVDEGVAEGAMVAVAVGVGDGVIPGERVGVGVGGIVAVAVGVGDGVIPGVRVGVGVGVAGVGVGVAGVGVGVAGVGVGVALGVTLGVGVGPPVATSRKAAVIGPQVSRPWTLFTPRPRTKITWRPNDRLAVFIVALTATVAELNVPFIGMAVPPAQGGVSM